MHGDRADAGQDDRAWASVVADPDRRRTAPGVLVTQSKRRGSAGLLLEAGNPIRLPLRLPERESDHAFSPLPRSTAASSNTCWHTWLRHASPVTTGSDTPSVSTMNTRPASSVFFHALKALIRSNAVHGTSMSWSVRRPVSAVCTRPKHWLNANREAPACRASTSCCLTVGSRQNLNVVCRLISAVSIPRPTDNQPSPAAAKAGITVDIVSGPKAGSGFLVQPRRWVVERTNGWINHCRRLGRHYEITLDAHEGFLMLSQIALLLRRLDLSQLYDTL